jgi:hypothetical protein
LVKVISDLPSRSLKGIGALSVSEKRDEIATANRHQTGYNISHSKRITGSSLND